LVGHFYTRDYLSTDVYSSSFLLKINDLWGCRKGPNMSRAWVMVGQKERNNAGEGMKQEEGRWAFVEKEMVLG
jgi:hypothetical protein